MVSGSVRQSLDKRGMLPMDRRVQILLDAARGLEFLHTNFHLVHCNVKRWTEWSSARISTILSDNFGVTVSSSICVFLSSSNILLDSNMKAKLSDFNFVKSMHKPGQLSGKLYTHITASTDDNIDNTGYLAREVLTASTYSNKSDVYAFGVVSAQSVITIYTDSDVHMHSYINTLWSVTSWYIALCS